MAPLQGLLAFVESARLGSLSGAARKLGLTPAAVSKSVLKLEAELGVRLFNRSTRRLRMTSEGDRFFARAEVILRALDEAVAEVGAATQAPTGKVRVSVGASFGRHWVIPALPELAARYPALQLEVDLENRPVDLVAEGVDIGIRGGVIRDSSLIARRICALPVLLVASPDYLAKRGVPRSKAALSQHDAVLVRFPSGQISGWGFLDEPESAYLPDARFVVSEPEAAVALAVAGVGIAQAGLHHVLPHLRAGRLHALLLGQSDPGQREIVLHYPHRQYLAPRVRVSVDFLLGHFAAAADLHLTLDDIRPYAA